MSQIFENGGLLANSSVSKLLILVCDACRIPPRHAGACNTFKEPDRGLWGILNKDIMEMDSSSRRNVGSISRNASRSSSRRPSDKAGRDLRVDRVHTRTRLEASADAVNSAARAAETVDSK